MYNPSCILFFTMGPMIPAGIRMTSGLSSGMLNLKFSTRSTVMACSSMRLNSEIELVPCRWHHGKADGAHENLQLIREVSLRPSYSEFSGTHPMHPRTPAAEAEIIRCQ